MSNEQLIADLKAAREILGKGWCPIGLVNEHGDPCLMGALNKAITGSVYWKHAAVCAAAELDDRRRRAVNVLSVHLPGGTGGTGCGHLAAWNDSDSTHHQDVLDLYDKTIADLGGAL